MKLKKSGIFTKLTILALILYAVVTLVSLSSQISEANAEKEALQQEIDSLTVSNAELEYDLEHSTDPEIIEDIAREKLGLVMPGEKVFSDDG